MYIFSGKSIDDIVIEEPNQIAINCRHYDLKKENGEIIAILYGGDMFSFIKSTALSVKIEKKKEWLKKPVYIISNQISDELLGSFEFLREDAECILWLNKGSTYFFHQDSSLKCWMKIKTWNEFEHTMTNSSDTIIYRGRISNGLLDGVIESTDDSLILPILLGLFILEEKIRIFNENHL